MSVKLISTYDGRIDTHGIDLHPYLQKWLSQAQYRRVEEECGLEEIRKNPKAVTEKLILYIEKANKNNLADYEGKLLESARENPTHEERGQRGLVITRGTICQSGGLQVEILGVDDNTRGVVVNSAEGILLLSPKDLEPLNCKKCGGPVWHFDKGASCDNKHKQ
jgi:hypothetical protein